MTEANHTLDERVFAENSKRARLQNELPIQVIIGNPPYSAGQKNANDANANDSYPSLDDKIEQTYINFSAANNKRQMYDSYIRAFRWATDRIADQGIICFVSNAGWLRGSAAAGIRKCLIQEFDDIYVFDLRGNSRVGGEEAKLEGGNVFNVRVGITITLLVKKNGDQHAGRIHYHDVGGYLSGKDKLARTKWAADTGEVDWQQITPDKYGDWLDQRDDLFYEFAPISLNKFTSPLGIFSVFSLGIATGRDNWAWNFSKDKVKQNMFTLIEHLNLEIDRYAASNGNVKPEDFVNYDRKNISWNRNQLDDVKRGRHAQYGDWHVVEGMYRPFCKQYVYYCKQLTARTYQQPRIFPLIENKQNQIMPTNEHAWQDNKEVAYQNDDHQFKNIVIMVTGSGGGLFSPFISKVIPDLNSMKAGAQCFPLYWYEETKHGETRSSASKTDQLVLEVDYSASSDNSFYRRHDAITDEALKVFQNVYPIVFAARSQKDGGSELTKEDIFYYIYGILHSPEYRKRFAANLKKQLPRIPLAKDFAVFANAGRRLANLHLNYETVEPWSEITETGDSYSPGRVSKMRFGKCQKTKDNPRGEDRTVLVVTDRLTLLNIPLVAYNYEVNGKSAIHWLMDQYRVKTDKDSGIVKDPNEYSADSRYVVDLIKRVVTVSMETLAIVSSLPSINELPQPDNWPTIWKTQ